MDYISKSYIYHMLSILESTGGSEETCPNSEIKNLEIAS